MSEQVREGAKGGHVAEEAAPDAVEVNAILPHPIDHVWRVLTTNDGVQAFLGDGARLGGKGEPWRADDGSHGVWRSYHPLEQVRLSWHAHEHAPRSLVELQLRPEGEDKTRVLLRHEKSGQDGETLKRYWTNALGRIDAAVH